MNRSELIVPKLPLSFKNRRNFLILISALFFFLFLPWVAFTVGNGKVTAINPNERLQSITAPVSGFIEAWKVKEGDRVKEGDILVDLTDNDPGLLERLSREKDAALKGLNSSKLMMETAELNLNRQKKLYEQGLSARADFEKAKIEYSKNSLEYAKAIAILAKAETQLSRQSTQRVLAPRDGTIVRILPGERGQLIKAGYPIAIFSPDITLPAVELWITGNDASIILPGQKAQIQFEGWPSLQIPGWPSLAIGTFDAKVHLVDQASSHQGKFRVLLTPNGPWPSQRILRLGINARGYIGLQDTFILKEIWRLLNGFPPVLDPIKDELDKMLNKGLVKSYKDDKYSSDSSKDKSGEKE